MSAPTMTIDGVEYREAKPRPKSRQGAILRACTGCAFVHKESCMHVCWTHAPQAFGGDCEDRDVIYVRAEQPEQQK